MAREKKIASDDDMSITHDSHYQSLQNTVKDCYQKPQEFTTIGAYSLLRDSLRVFRLYHANETAT